MGRRARALARRETRARWFDLPGSRGAVVETLQYHGTIVDVDAQDGIAVSPVGLDELFWLPPDLRAFEEAPRGAYRLRSTGELVLHPDLLCSWTVRKPARGGPTPAE